MMIVFGILFVRDVYYSSSGEVAPGSLIKGAILLLAGGGLLSSTISETVRKLLKK
jgi:hypothetical protein